MDMLVKDLLAYTQSANMEGEAEEEVDAAEALDKALSNLSAAINESNAEITHGGLPSLRVPEVQLEQLFQNLIGNAIKYRKDDEHPRIRITAARESGRWLFSVSDNGIGIPAEYKERVFGIFKRLHGSGKYSGTGIGLAICQKIVERNGGRIWVDSEGTGKGSTFHFTLPAAAE
jgi:light-regulated signal transduction histidine kinase (bacteriophytochrome)